MSQPDKDTVSIAPEQVAESLDENTVSEKVIQITETELGELANLLATFKFVILGHEDRIAALEELANKPVLLVPPQD